MSIPLGIRSPHMKSFPITNLRKAFTLVETTIAMGIVAFAMVPILGLVPMGLSSFRSAISCTAEAQIVQALSNEILLTDYNLVTTKYASEKLSYYSDEGEVLASAGDPAKIYTAKVILQDVAAPAHFSVTPSPSKCALIEISSVGNPAHPKKYSLVIPRG
jgi:uncharacterized protein (TIGR02598 family)